jgi:carboxylesterase type B
MRTTQHLFYKALTSLVAIQACCAESFCQGPVVTVQNGSYAGLYQQNYQQDFFLGVPYAQPPVGDLRLRVAASLDESWSDVRNATAYSPQCVGYGGDDIGYETSEDCLTLNVIRPTGTEGQNLPVAVWIHGGGYVMGGG